MRLKNKRFKTALPVTFATNSVSMVLGIVLSVMLVFLTDSDLFGEESRWSGVDEAVVERFAKEHGRESKEPLINTDQGDLLLFVFLIAGAGGGFVAGYYWRRLTEQQTR